MKKASILPSIHPPIYGMILFLNMHSVSYYCGKPITYKKTKNTEMNTEKENMFYLFCVCHHGTGINFSCQVLCLKEKSFCLVQLGALISSNNSNTRYHISINEYYRNKWR